ncbi:hypothetical protein [Nonomuraea rhizosphaerae]|uniref:hypothetical protein n=1 Tax=Nonomuraea rhizosphaerae TaxID=2665663 RepID=UPI001C5E29DB|nr:hypothetical protein [Nonomuraea rhizosphaerae]
MAHQKPARGGRRFVPSVPHHQVIERICTPLSPDEAHLQTVPLPLGGVRVWTDLAGRGGKGPSWVVHQRMARQVARVGWRAEATAERVLVLGWSPASLKHRARLLQNALSGRLADYRQSAEYAVSTAVRLHEERPDGEAARSEIVAATCEELNALLLWPQRLAELDGLERTSRSRRLQLLIAQVAGLEAKVRRACSEHQLLARTLAGWTSDHLADVDAEQARQQTLEEATPWLRALTGLANRPASGLSERVAASVTNGAVLL